MDWQCDSILAEHQFTIARVESFFSLETGWLRPYQASQGRWAILPLFFASSGALSGEEPFNNGVQLLCYQTVSGNGTPLSILQFSLAEFEKSGRCLTFGTSQRPLLLNRNADRLYFELRTVAGSPVQLEEKDGEVLLGLSLLQLQH